MKELINIIWNILHGWWTFVSIFDVCLVVLVIILIIIVIYLYFINKKLKKELEELKDKHFATCHFEPGLAYEVICEFILHALKSLDITFPYITCEKIADKLIEAHLRGIKIRIITDKEYINLPGSKILKLQEAGISICLISNAKMNKMNCRFIIRDSYSVLTGSYDFTEEAPNNAENILIIKLPSIVTQYQKYFDRLWKSKKKYRR